MQFYKSAKLDIFPCSKVRLPILALCIQSWSLKKWLVVFWNSRMLYWRLFLNLYPRKTNSNKVSGRIFVHRALPLRFTDRTELYLSLVGKKCRFFVSVLGNISVYALVILITLSVLMIYRNLTFLDTKQSGVQLVFEIQRVLGVQIRKSFVMIRDWREKIQWKTEKFLKWSK